MDYIEIRFEPETIPGFLAEVLPTYLGPLGYDSFMESEDGLKAYISAEAYDKFALQACLNSSGFENAVYTETLVPGKNWNEEWEKNYEPVIIDNRCLIRAPFHHPDTSFPIEIVIEPKMSFGTGHHETTSLMISEMLAMDFSGCSVLDAGCGTGILAILAEKLGAADVLAVDNDPWCIENATENLERNNCRIVRLKLVESSLDLSMQVDRIVANINLNVLTEALPHFSFHLKPQGILVMSGILASDISTLQDRAKAHGLKFSGSRMKQNWALVRFTRIG